MKVPIDESLPTRLWRLLAPHKAFTVDYPNWLGVKNGALLTLAQAAEFEVFLTADKNLGHQQNLEKLGLGIVVLSSNLQLRIEPQLNAILEAIESSIPGSLKEIEL